MHRNRIPMHLISHVNLAPGLGDRTTTTSHKTAAILQRRHTAMVNDKVNFSLHVCYKTYMLWSADSRQNQMFAIFIEYGRILCNVAVAESVEICKNF